MKVFDIINPYKAMVESEMLEETRLSTDFSIGFELEAICDSNVPELRDRGNLPDYHSGSTRESGGALYMKNLLNKLLDMGEGKLNSLGTGEVASIENGRDIKWYKDMPGEWYINSNNNSVYCVGCDYKEDLGIPDSVNIDAEEPLKIGYFNSGNDFTKTEEGMIVAKKFPILNGLSINKSKIERDGSVTPDSHTNDTGHAWGFEWASPIIKFNPTNIQKIYKFLTSLKDYGIYTNNNCGFHTHISYDGINKDDVKWILFSIANDERLLDQITYLRVPGEEPVKFFGETYANDEWFRQLKAHGNLKDWNFSGSTNAKYLQIRIHPGAGTLEWRGPRNFINHGENTVMIKEYLTKLWKLILDIAKIVDMNEYNGYKKSDVLDKMKIHGEFNTATEKLNLKSYSSLINILNEKPSVLITLKPSKLKTLAEKNIGSIISSLESKDGGTIWNKLPKGNKKIIIENIDEYYLLSRLLKAITKDNNNIDSITTGLLFTCIKSPSILSELSKDYLDKLTIDSSELLEKIYNSELPNKMIMRIISKYPRMVSMKIFMDIAKSSDRGVLASFSELPLKVQKMLIRKNPYNIQYINNPDQSVIDELKKKYKNDDIEEYILGVL